MVSALTTTKSWWLYLLQGLFTVLFGVMMLVWPGVTVFLLILIIGTFVLVDGLFPNSDIFGQQA